LSARPYESCQNVERPARGDGRWRAKKERKQIFFYRKKTESAFNQNKTKMYVNYFSFLDMLGLVIHDFWWKEYFSRTPGSYMYTNSIELVPCFGLRPSPRQPCRFGAGNDGLRETSARAHMWVWAQNFWASLRTHNTTCEPAVRKSGGE